MEIRRKKNSFDNAFITQDETNSFLDKAPIKKTLFKRLKFTVSNLLGLLTKRNLLIIVFIILLSGFSYYFIQYRKLSKTPDSLAKEKTESVIKEIKSIAVIPDDPHAVLATVSDVSKLKNQHFFDKAENGDYVVLFPSELEAVIYRPSVHKIINIGPLSSASIEGTGSASNGTSSKSSLPKTSTNTQSSSVLKKN